MKYKIVFVIIAHLYFNIIEPTQILLKLDYLKKDIFMHLLGSLNSIAVFKALYGIH